MKFSWNDANPASDTRRLVRDDDIDDSELFGIKEIRCGQWRVLEVSASRPGIGQLRVVVQLAIEMFNGLSQSRTNCGDKANEGPTNFDPRLALMG